LSNDTHCWVAACLDGVIRLVDRESGELLQEYSGHESGSFRLAASITPDDAYVVSGSQDGSVIFWDLVTKL
jgi:mitogen-activated protein kinase organizer 1